MRKTVFTLLIAGLIFSGCSEKKEMNQNTAEAVKVRVVTATRGSINPELVYPATIQAGKEANLGASLPGRVEHVYYKEGDHVKKGALLAEMSGELYTQAMAEYEAVKKDYDRVERLKAKGSVTEQEYDHVKALYDGTSDKVEMLKKNTRIVAPFDGVIVDFIVQEGENYFFSPSLEPGYSMTSGIVKLMQIDPLKVTFDVNERNLSSVHKGMAVKFTAGALADTFTAKVSLIKPALSVLTRAATIEALVPNHHQKLLPGMSARVWIKLPEVKGVVVPVACLIHRAGSDEEYVIQIVDGKARITPVTRLCMEGETAIVTGVEDGAKVAITGKDRLYEGTAVSVVNE